MAIENSNTGLYNRFMKRYSERRQEQEFKQNWMKTHESVLLFCKVIFRHVSMRDSYLNWRDAISLNSTRTHTHIRTDKDKYTSRNASSLFSLNNFLQVSLPHICFPLFFFNDRPRLIISKRAFFLKLFFKIPITPKQFFWTARHLFTSLAFACWFSFCLASSWMFIWHLFGADWEEQYVCCYGN